MSAHSPSMGGAAPLGFAARVRLNVDLPLLRKSRRRPEIAYSWFPLPTAAAPHHGGMPRTVDALARAIHDGLGLKCGSHRDLLLRVDGYALAHDVDIAVVRDGDVVHVSAPTSLHGGPWPQSPMGALPNELTNPINFVATPATAPPALAPRRLAPETMPQRADTEGKERSRSARRKALKRSRARAEKYGINPGGGDGREIPPPPPRYAAPPTKRSRLAPKDAPPARAARVIRPLSAGAHSLDPNGDLAANGGSLASWDERGWVPRPDDAALAAAQAQRQRAGSKSKRVDAAVDAARKKIGFESKPDAETRASSSSDTSSSSSSSSSDSSDSEEETRKAPAGREDDDDELVKKEWLSLVAAGDSSSASPGLDIEPPGGVEPGDVITYVLHGRKLRGVVEEVRPDFGGDGGGVRMSAAIVPFTEELRVRGLRFAAGLAARAATGVKQIPAPPFEGIELNGTVTVALDVLNVTARLIGGPRFKGEPPTKGELSKGELSNQKPATTPAIEADLEDGDDAEGSDPTEVREEKRWIDAARGRNDSGGWIPPPPAGDPPPTEGRGWTWEDLINDHAYDPYEQLGYDPHDTTPVRPVKPVVQLDRTYGIPVEMHAAAAAAERERDDEEGENRGVQVQSNGRKASRGGPGAPPTGAVVAQRWRQSGAAAAAAAAAAGGGAAAGTAPAGINADVENQVHSEPERAPTPEPTPEPRVAAAPPPKSPARGKGKGKEKDTRCPEQRALEVVLKRSMEEWRKSLPKGRRDLLTKDLAGKPGAAAKDFHLVASIHKFHWDKDTIAKRRDVVAELNTLWKSFQVYHQQ